MNAASIQKLADAFEMEYIDVDVYFEETDGILPALVWDSKNLKLTDHCRGFFKTALDCPARIENGFLLITSGTDVGIESNVRGLLITLAGFVPVSYYDRMVAVVQ
ncbi:MAG: hypothetical protein LBE57_04725 [Methanosarcinales archaeon]|jgi:hypothetical protein|nr:hypothetical protein [Methanosarcinales archaeon]